MYYKRSTNAGVSWEPDIRLTNSSGDSYNPSLVVSGTFLHLTWEDLRDGNYEIYYKRSTNSGVNWSADTRLTNASADSRYASVITSGNFVHTVWFDDRDGNREIYFKRDPTGNQLPTAPPAPVLVSPPHNSFNNAVSVRFIWNRSLFADSYRLQVSNDSLFTNLVFNDSTLADSTVYLINFTLNKYYWWRVNAKNNSGISPYSTIWKFGTFLVGIQPVNGDIPVKFKLYNSFPNPFNPSTKIKFQIPLLRGVSGEAGQLVTPGRDGVFTSLKIFDILGREVRSLVNESLNPGIYEADFNAAELPSGIYFYTLNAGEFSDTKKMILIK
ncbi:MAG: T9SS type A sorting domain-containing protein [Ignavibacteria bacterium]|nr:T9SS type A sorting domain-containing protein [Ignavibacteria bacterium]